MSANSTWRKDIDGLRGIAVLFVVGNHLGIPFFRGGYIGVDIFFIISGFLITNQLTVEYSNKARLNAGLGYVSLLGFYLRRARRILPAATFISLFVVLYSFSTQNSLKASKNAIEGLWAASFLMNWHLINTSADYFHLGSTPSPFVHYWSLGVEEQFYLFAPILFLLIVSFHGFRIFARRIWWQQRLAIVFSIIFGISCLASLLSSFLWPAFAYFSTITRAWELALGALIACLMVKPRAISEKRSFYYSYVGILLIIFADLFFSPTQVYPGFLALIPTFGASLIIFCGAQKSSYFTANNFLKFTPLRFFGKISFSLYLIHWPVIVFFGYSNLQTFGALEAVIALVTMILLSYFSYIFIETPFRKIQISERWLESKRRHASNGAILPFSFSWKFFSYSGLLIFILFMAFSSRLAPTNLTKFEPLPNPIENRVGSVENTTKGIEPTDVSSATPEAQNISFGELQTQWSQKIAIGMQIKKLPQILNPEYSKLKNLNFWHQISSCKSELVKISCSQGSGDTKILVTGDSHGRMLDLGIKRAFPDSKFMVVGKYRANCKFTTAVPWDDSQNVPVSDCDKFRQSTYDWILQYRPALIVVSQQDNTSYAQNGKLAPSNDWFRLWQGGLKQGFEPLLGAGSKLLIVGQTPAAAPLIDCVNKDMTFSSSCYATGSSVSQWITASERNAESLQAKFLNISDWMCVNDKCPPIINNRIVFVDGSHISDSFAAELGPLFRTYIKENLGIG